MIYKKRRKIFFVDEITMPYNHVAQFNAHKGIIFTKYEIIMSGGNNVVVVKGLWNRPAKRAKKIIDNKVYQAHNKDHNNNNDSRPIMDKIELSLSRLKELHRKEQIGKKEFEKRKKKILDTMHHDY